MARVKIMVGFPGSGKSTYAKKAAGKRFSADDLRLELGLDPGDRSVFEILDRQFSEAIRNNEDVIYDATSLRKDNREKLIRLAKESNRDAVVTAVFFDTPLDVCKRRNAKREGVARVPDFVYDRMMRTFAPPTLDEGFSEVIVIK